MTSKWIPARRAARSHTSQRRIAAHLIVLDSRMEEVFWRPISLAVAALTVIQHIQIIQQTNVDHM